MGIEPFSVITFFGYLILVLQFWCYWVDDEFASSRELSLYLIPRILMDSGMGVNIQESIDQCC